MTTIYELAPEHRQMVESMLESGMDEQTIRDTLEAESGLYDKLDAIFAVLTEKQARAAAMAAEIERLGALLNTEESQLDRLRGLLEFGLKASGEKKIERPLYTVSLRKSPPAVIVDDESQIPRDYYTDPAPPAPRLDKALVKKALQEGHHVPGVHIEQRLSLQIR